ncbi:MAG: hypothetical protein DKM22_05415 [Candidatus Melainabacteria bacterium]|nr:MAG: hypothetical protein DKM22_05415 [Candidatus Melainabacteria bacterium]
MDMKKFLIILLIFLNTNFCFGADFKSFFKGEKSDSRIPVELKNNDSEEMTLSEYATLYYGENNLDEALNSLTKIKDDDRSASDWLLLGNIMQEKGKKNEALFMYNRAIMKDKTFYKAYYNAGVVYLEDEQYNSAIKNFKLASKYNDEFPYAYYNLGCAYTGIGELKKAKIAFLKAIGFKNTVPEFHFNLAYIYKQLGNEKLSRQYLDNYNRIILGY